MTFLPSPTLGGVDGWLEPPADLQTPAGAIPSPPALTPSCPARFRWGARDAPFTSRCSPVPPRHVQHQHRYVVVLFITGEHPVNQESKQSGRILRDAWRDLRGDRDQLVEPRVQAPAPVLDQPIGVEHGGVAWRQAEHVLLAGTGPAQRRPGLSQVEPWRGVTG